MATLEETLRKLGLATARGVPQLATGFVDLAALPFTATGMLRPEQVFGSTDYLTSKGLLPPEQKGLLGETTELLSGALNPATATKAALAKGGLLFAPIAAGMISPKTASEIPQYMIVKSVVGTSKGGEKTAWNIVDPKDGFVIDTFSLKRDAKTWLENALNQEKNK